MNRMSRVRFHIRHPGRPRSDGVSNAFPRAAPFIEHAHVRRAGGRACAAPRACGRARATISLTVDVRHAGLEGDHTVPLHPRERTYACLTCGALQSCALAAPESCPFLALRVVHSTASVRDAA